MRYSADLAQQRHDENATAKGAPIKLGNDYEFARYVEDRILNDKLSPDVIIGRMNYEGIKFQCSVCTRTLYN